MGEKTLEQKYLELNPDVAAQAHPNRTNDQWADYHMANYGLKEGRPGAVSFTNNGSTDLDRQLNAYLLSGDETGTQHQQEVAKRGFDLTPMQRLYQDVASGNVQVSSKDFNKLLTDENRGMSEWEFNRLPENVQAAAKSNPHNFMQAVLANRNPANYDLLSVGAEGGVKDLGAYQTDSKNFGVDPSQRIAVTGKSWFENPVNVGSLALAGFGLMNPAMFAADQAGMLAAQEAGLSGAELAGWGGATTGGLESLGTSMLRGAGMAGAHGGNPITGAISGGLGSGLNAVLPTDLDGISRGAITGAAGSMLHGGNPLTGAISGGASGAAGSVISDTMKAVSPAQTQGYAKMDDLTYDSTDTSSTPDSNQNYSFGNYETGLGSRNFGSVGDMNEEQLAAARKIIESGGDATQALNMARTMDPETLAALNAAGVGSSGFSQLLDKAGSSLAKKFTDSPLTTLAQGATLLGTLSGLGGGGASSNPNSSAYDPRTSPYWAAKPANFAPRKTVGYHKNYAEGGAVDTTTPEFNPNVLADYKTYGHGPEHVFFDKVSPFAVGTSAGEEANKPKKPVYTSWADDPAHLAEGQAWVGSHTPAEAAAKAAEMGLTAGDLSKIYQKTGPSDITSYINDPSHGLSHQVSQGATNYGFNDKGVLTAAPVTTATPAASQDLLSQFNALTGAGNYQQAYDLGRQAGYSTNDIANYYAEHNAQPASDVTNYINQNLHTYARGGEVQGDMQSKARDFPRGYLKGGDSGQSDKVPAMLSNGEYVMDAATVSDLGDGNSDAGAKALDAMRHHIRNHKRTGAFPPKAKSPLEYLKG